MTTLPTSDAEKVATLAVAVSVANVAPTVTAPADQTVNEGASTSISLGSFTDPGADNPWAVDVNWGDGSTDTTFNTSATGVLRRAAAKRSFQASTSA